MFFLFHSNHYAHNVPRVLVICLFIVSLQKDYPNLFVFFDNLKFNGGAFSGAAFFIKFLMLIKSVLGLSVLSGALMFNLREGKRILAYLTSFFPR